MKTFNIKQKNTLVSEFPWEFSGDNGDYVCGVQVEDKNKEKGLRMIKRSLILNDRYGFKEKEEMEKFCSLGNEGEKLNFDELFNEYNFNLIIAENNEMEQENEQANVEPMQCAVCEGNVNVGEEHICQGNQELKVRNKENPPAIRITAGDRNEDGTFKPGVSGNPSGRPKGTMKDYLRRKFMELSDENKEQFLIDNKVTGLDQIKLAEGNPEQKNESDVKVSGMLDVGALFDKSKLNE